MKVLALRLKDQSLQLRTQRRGGQLLGQSGTGGSNSNPSSAGGGTSGAGRAGSREQAATVFLSKHLFTLFKDNLNPVRATREKKVRVFLQFVALFLVS